MKKILMLLLAAILMVGCVNTKENSKKVDKNEPKSTQSGNTKKKKVAVTTTFVNDMVKNLVGDKVDINVLIPAGSDPHVYEAKPEDLKKLDESDLIIYHGLHFEGKINKVLEGKGKEITRGFEESELGKVEEDGEIQTDPHFWFDLNLYKKAMRNTAVYLSELLPSEKESIEKSLQDYNKKLDELDKYIKEQISKIPEYRRFLITPHDAFNYFARFNKFTVKAPQGVNTDSEVSNSDIEETAVFIVQNKIKAIFAESTTNPDRMKKLQEVVKSKGFELNVVSGEEKELLSDSLAPQGQKGDNFIDMYKHNVDLIVNNLK